MPHGDDASHLLLDITDLRRQSSLNDNYSASIGIAVTFLVSPSNWLFTLSEHPAPSVASFMRSQSSTSSPRASFGNRNQPKATMPKVPLEP